MSEHGIPVPGWYEDPHDPKVLRYWDGRTWTEHRTLKPPPAQHVAYGPVGAPAMASASTPVGHTSGMPWWGWLLIAMVAVFIVVGVLVTLAWQYSAGDAVEDTDEQVVEYAPDSGTGEPGLTTFGPGVYLAGVDIEAGTYRMREREHGETSTIPCFWEISEDGETLDHSPITGGKATVTVTEGQALNVGDCGLWVRTYRDDLFTNPDAYPTLLEGTWLVGEDVAPGRYRAKSEVVMETFYDACFVEIAEGVESNFSDIVLDEQIEEGRPEITLAAGQQVTTLNCGGWRRTESFAPDGVEAGLRGHGR